VKQADFQHGYSLPCISTRADRGPHPVRPAASAQPTPDPHCGGSEVRKSALHAPWRLHHYVVACRPPGSAGLAGYCATKGGVRLLAKTVAMECAVEADGI